MEKVLGCFGLLIVVAVLSLLGAWLASLLWNWLAPLFFAAPVLSVWQAWGILALLGIVGRTVFGRKGESS